MNTKTEHKKIVDFVNGFKEANKNKVERVRTYDKGLRCWTYEVVKKDENAAKFYETNVKKNKTQKEKDKRRKENKAKAAQPGFDKSKMHLYVVRHYDQEKLTFQEIADKYGVSQSTVRRAYSKEKTDESSLNT